MRLSLLAQHDSKNLFARMLFVTRACYINSNFVDSIIELNLHNVNYILTLFPCCFITYCATVCKLMNHYIGNRVTAGAFRVLWARVMFCKFSKPKP